MASILQTAGVDSTKLDEPVFRVSLDSPSDSKAINQWRDLEASLGDVPLTCSLAWTETWLSVFGKTIPHRFAVGRVDHQAQAMCLVCEGQGQRQGPFAVRSVHVGTAGEIPRDSAFVEYNELLVGEEYRANFASELYGRLCAESWDEVRLDGFEAERIHEFIGESARVISQPSTSYYFDLAAARDESIEILSRFGASTRKGLKRALNGYVGLSVDWAESSDTAHAMFTELAKLHQARWIAAGEPGCYSSELFVEFHRALIDRLLPEARVILVRVRAGNETIGCLQLFVDRNRVLFYQGGWTEGLKNRSPGMLLHFLCMQECLRRGYDAYDFLAGESRYKKSLSTNSTSLIWATRRRAALKFALLDTARAGKRRLRGLRKNGSER